MKRSTRLSRAVACLGMVATVIASTPVLAAPSAPSARPAPEGSGIVLKIDLTLTEGLRSVSMQDARWANLNISIPQLPFGNCGCWLSTAATIMSYRLGFPGGGSIPKYPVDLPDGSTIFSFSPVYLDAESQAKNSYLPKMRAGLCATGNRPDAWIDSAYPIPDPITGKPLTPTGITWTTHDGFGPETRAKVDAWLQRGWPLAITTRRDVPLEGGGTKEVTHEQMIVGFDPTIAPDGEYLVLDPGDYPGRAIAGGNTYRTDGFNYQGWLDTVIDVRFITPTYGPVKFFGLFDDPEPIELRITDPLGRRTGHDPLAGRSYNEQPDGSYERVVGWTDPLGEAPPADDEKRYWTVNPVDGVYAVEVFGTGTGPWTLDAWEGGDSYTHRLSGNTTPGQIDRYEITLINGEVADVRAVAQFGARADAGPDQVTIPGATFTVDGHRSAAPTSSITSYSWDFGDGTVSSDRRVSHSFPDAGSRTVSLTVTAANGTTATDTMTVRVIEPPGSGRVTSMVTTDPADPTKSATSGSSSGQHAVVTPDGRFAAMAVPHTLGGGSTNQLRLYRKDLTTGAVQPLVPTGDVQGLTDISDDGRLVTFIARSALLPADNDTADDLYLIDVQTGALELVGLTDADVPMGDGIDDSTVKGTTGGAMSSDGRFVLVGWRSPEVTNVGIFLQFGRDDVFLRDRLNGTTVRISETPGGEAASSVSFPWEVSADGNTVVYTTFAGNLLGGSGGHNYPTMVVRNVSSGAIEQIYLGGVSRNVYRVDLSADGRYVALLSNGQEYLPFEQRTSFVVPEPWLFDRVTDTYTHLAAPIDGIRPIVAGVLNFGSYSIDISDNGRWVAFQHRADNVIPGDDNGTGDAFLYDVSTGTLTRESVSTLGVQSAGTVPISSGNPSGTGVAVDDSGAMMFFSNATDLTPAITNQSTWNLYRRGEAPGGTNGAPEASLGGPYLGFTTSPEWPATVRLDASYSADPEGDLLAATIDPGDGSDTAGGDPLALVHSYSEPGRFTAAATVTDGNLGSAPAFAEVEIIETPSDDAVFLDACTEPGELLFIGGTALTANSALVADGWDLSQGPVPLADVDLDLSWGGALTAASELPTLAFRASVTAPTEPGTYTVSLRGTSAEASFTVPCPVGPTPPIADAGGPYQVRVGEPLRFDGSGSIRAQSFLWSFGDGANATDEAPVHTFARPGKYLVKLVVGDEAAPSSEDLLLSAAALDVYGLRSDDSVGATSAFARVEVLAAEPPPSTTTTTTTVPGTTPASAPSTQPPTTSPPPLTTAPPVVQPPFSGRIPETGSDAADTLWAALAMLATGVGLVALVRRRRRARPLQR